MKEEPASTESSEERLHQLKRDVDGMSERFQLLKKEVDALQVAVLAENIPWYRQVSTIVAVLALIFSFGTTYVSHQRTNQLDVENDRTQLREILNRLSALPKENLQYQAIFSNNQEALHTMAGYLANEQSYLADQAAELAMRLPVNRVTAQEYNNIAHAMLNQMWFNKAIKFYKTASEIATDFNTENTALRSLSGALFQTERHNEARKVLSEALLLNTKYKEIPKTVYSDTIILTRIAWASGEYFGANDRDAALEQIVLARKILQEPSASILRQKYEAQVDRLEWQINNNIKSPNIPFPLGFVDKKKVTQVSLMTMTNSLPSIVFEERHR